MNKRRKRKDPVKAFAQWLKREREARWKFEDEVLWPIWKGLNRDS